MSGTGLTDFIHINRMPSGRAAYAMGRVLEGMDQPHGGVEGAVVAVPAVIREAAEAALEGARVTVRLEMQRRDNPKGPMFGPKAAKLDAEIDRTLGAMVGLLRSYVAVLEADHPRRVAAQRLLDEVFSGGARPITHMSYVEEKETVQLLLGRFGTGGDLRGAVEGAGLLDFVERLGALHGEFSRALENREPGVTWDEVRAARAAHHLGLVRFIAIVLGTYPGDEPAHVVARARLLEPIQRQEDALVGAYRRGQPTDVDPETGVEQVPGEGPLVSGEQPAGPEDPATPTDVDSPGPSGPLAPHEVDGVG